MKISEVMNKVVSVEEDISLIEAAKVFSKEGIGSLVYIKEGKALGIITDRDLIKQVEHLKKKKISQVMNKELVTIFYEDELEDAALLMTKKKVKRLLVVDENDSLVGIITATDILANADLLNRSFSFF
jgi:CBS domain-containing protein